MESLQPFLIYNDSENRCGTSEEVGSVVLMELVVDGCSSSSIHRFAESDQDSVSRA